MLARGCLCSSCVISSRDVAPLTKWTGSSAVQYLSTAHAQDHVHEFKGKKHVREGRVSIPQVITAPVRAPAPTEANAHAHAEAQMHTTSSLAFGRTARAAHPRTLRAYACSPG
eukprot:1473845-Pleurochrysis_carterae.AAC.1